MAGSPTPFWAACTVARLADFRLRSGPDARNVIAAWSCLNSQIRCPPLCAEVRLSTHSYVRHYTVTSIALPRFGGLLGGVTCGMAWIRPMALAA